MSGNFLEQVLREIVRDEVAACLGAAGAASPDLITTDEAADICDCDASVILNLFHDREANGFPGIVLGKKTFKIDRTRLNAWLARGGLGGKGIDDEPANVKPFGLVRAG